MKIDTSAPVPFFAARMDREMMLFSYGGPENLSFKGSLRYLLCPEILSVVLEGVKVSCTVTQQKQVRPSVHMEGRIFYIPRSDRPLLLPNSRI